MELDEEKRFILGKEYGTLLLLVGVVAAAVAACDVFLGLATTVGQVMVVVVAALVVVVTAFVDGCGGEIIVGGRFVDGTVVVT